MSLDRRSHLLALSKREFPHIPSSELERLTTHQLAENLKQAGLLNEQETKRSSMYQQHLPPQQQQKREDRKEGMDTNKAMVPVGQVRDRTTHFWEESENKEMDGVDSIYSGILARYAIYSESRKKFANAVHVLDVMEQQPDRYSKQQLNDVDSLIERQCGEQEQMRTKLLRDISSFVDHVKKTKAQDNEFLALRELDDGRLMDGWHKKMDAQMSNLMDNIRPDIVGGT